MKLSSYRAEIFTPETHSEMIQKYMSTTQVLNNKTPKALRLTEYDGQKGALFLVIDDSNAIKAISSVLVEEKNSVKAAKIYGRLHIEPPTPHAVIDRYLEPMTFAWCQKMGINNLFMTINEGNYRVLDWACRRIGERRNVFRPNKYFPNLGKDIRSQLRPHKYLIYERNCWQYAIYYSLDGTWFLERESKPLDDTALEVFKREFPNATQNWHELF